jgi:Flp pilus assembly protein CpaB
MSRPAAARASSEIVAQAIALDKSSRLDHLAPMAAERRTIEVDAETAERLEARAAARGLSISELVRELAAVQDELTADLAAKRAGGEGPWSPEALAEDARSLAAFRRTRHGLPWDEVRAWMESWGRPDERKPPKPRKL